MTDSRLADKFVLRLPEGLRDLYKQQAQLNGRSMNAEMIRVLQAGLGVSVPAEERIRRLESLVAGVLGEPEPESDHLDYQAVEMERKQLRRSIRQVLVFVKEVTNASPIQRSNMLEKVANELRRAL